jgi:peptide deformylase
LKINTPNNGDASTQFHEDSDSAYEDCLTLEPFAEKVNLVTMDIERVKQITVKYHDFMNKTLKSDVKR